MTEKLQHTVQDAGSQGQNAVNTASDKWNAMSDEQKKQAFDSLPEEQKQGKTYTEWIKEGLHSQYENWMPWIEDQYLRWFTKDNKASYATKDTLDKSKITGVEQVDQLQDGVHSVAAGTVGQGGVLQPIGDMASKEGLNRMERGGKDSTGSYGNTTSPMANDESGLQGIGGSVVSGAKSAGGYVGGMLPGAK